MNSRAFITGLTFAFVCACVANQAEAGWRQDFNIAELTRSNPGIQSILDGPLGLIIDVVVEIVLYLVDFILGGEFAPLKQFQKLEKEVKTMRKMLQGDQGGVAAPTLV